MSAPALRIAICGAGPVGLALAGFLAQGGHASENIRLIDGKSLEQAQRDPRSIALSWGSRQLLERIGAFPQQVSPITEIHVSRRGHFGRTLIDADTHGLPALGYVCRYGDLVGALAGACARMGVVSLRPRRILALEQTPDEVRLQLDNGEVLASDLAVQAEGGVFGDTAPAAHARVRDYRQQAIVATVKSNRPPPGRAFERCTDQGPLALLPQDDGYALVWCLRPDAAERLLQLPDDAFLAALQEAFGDRAGRFLSVQARAGFMLGLQTQPAAGARTVAIGNAAQTLHPVAGQGLNLGLRDAAVLAQRLGQTRLASDPAAITAALASYVRERQSDRNMTIRVTDLLARAFASPAGGGLGQGVLSLSLGLLDALPPAKRMLAEHMLFGQR